MTEKTEVKCSFCGRGQYDPKVKQLVRGDGDVAICDECIEVCRDVIGAAREARRDMPEDEAVKE